jgi:hypothetical protein
MLGPIEVLKFVVTKLEELRVNYFLVGSLASMYYSRPRFTNDIDLVLQIAPTQIKEFSKAFESEEFYCPPPEVLHDEVMRRGSFNLIHQDSGIKIDIVLAKQSEFSKSEMTRRKNVEMIPGFFVFIATAEDVILKKLDFFREGNSEKYLQDIREILGSSPVDHQYIQHWVQKLSLTDVWEKTKV